MDAGMAFFLSVVAVVVMPIVVLVGGIIIATGRSKISRREAHDIRTRLESLEARLETLTKAVVGSPVITEKDAAEIAQEAARLAEARQRSQQQD